MIRRILRQDLAWAGGIILLAAALGLGLQWQLLRLSWSGKLPAYLEARREKRLQEEFPGGYPAGVVAGFQASVEHCNIDLLGRPAGQRRQTATEAQVVHLD